MAIIKDLKVIGCKIDPKRYIITLNKRQASKASKDADALKTLREFESVGSLKIVDWPREEIIMIHDKQHLQVRISATVKRIRISIDEMIRKLKNESNES